MLEFQVLIKRAFRSIGPLTRLDWAAIMPLNFVSSPSEPFFPILITFLALLNFLAFLLELTEFYIQLVPLVD